jgi:eukaryotic-like serine/threonine-protein kinase
VEDDDQRPTEAMAIPPVHAEPVGGIEDVVDPFELATGTDVGGYVIDGELGRGGMGVVYSATHPVIGKRAAIKVLKPSLSNNPATVERFIQEARSVNAIGHPNIVDIFDFDALPDGRRYLVMDLLEGESLRKRVKRGPLHIHEAALVIDEIASALNAAHDKGFIHRDLKPDNVFLVVNPGRFDVRLLDFGLAKLLPNAMLSNARAYRTATGAQLGTPDYMSPEQLRGDKDIDHRTDIYALGVLAFEIITGKRPKRFVDGAFDLGATPAEVVGAVSFVPAELAQLVETMLAARPDDRPSLVAVRAVIKRVRPSLPSMSVVGLELAAMASAQDLPLSAMSPSKVGARPVVPTPATGTPSGPPVAAARAPGQPSVAPRAPVPPSIAPHAAGQPASPPPSSFGPSSAGLRTGATVPRTKLGVPPPPVTISRRQPIATVADGSRVWLIVGIVLALAAGVALALVIAS